MNGTSALQVSLRLAGVCPGNEVIVPALTFIAPVNAVDYNGASPIFMDVDKYYNLDIKKTIDFIQIGTGSLGGKARGLAFARNMLEKVKNYLFQLKS